MKILSARDASILAIIAEHLIRNDVDKFDLLLNELSDNAKLIALSMKSSSEIIERNTADSILQWAKDNMLARKIRCKNIYG